MRENLVNKIKVFEISFLDYFLETEQDRKLFNNGFLIIVLISILDLFGVIITNNLRSLIIFINLSFVIFMGLNYLFVVKIKRTSYLSQRYKVVYFLISIIVIGVSYFILYFFTILEPTYQPDSIFYSKLGFSYGFAILFFLDANSIWEIDSKQKTGKTLKQVRKSDKKLMKYEHQALLLIISIPVMAILTAIFTIIVKAILNSFGNNDTNLIVGISIIPFIIYAIYLIKFSWNFNDKVRKRRREVIRKLEFENNF